MEFCTLSKLTKNSSYCEHALAIIDRLENMATGKNVSEKEQAFYSAHVSYEHGTFSSKSTMGGMGDSFYEAIAKNLSLNPFKKI